MAAPLIQFVGDTHSLQVGGIKLLGFNAANARKLVFTIIFFVALLLISKLLSLLAAKLGGARQKTAFWTRQAISFITFFLAVAGFLSIWFDNPARLATGFGLLGAGLAFALQKVITVRRLLRHPAWKYLQRG